MKTVRVKKRSERVKEAATVSVARFWMRRPNPELDRSGDWLLKNLKSIRREASRRADPL